MIDPMRRYTYLVYHKEYEAFLDQLAELGVVHIVTKQQGDIMTEELQAKLDKLEQLKELITYVTPFGKVEDDEETSAVEVTPHEGSVARGEELTANIADLRTKREEALHQLQLLDKEVELMRPWGDFSLERVQQLRQAGYALHFYSCPARAYSSLWDTQYDIVKFREEDTMNFVVVSPVDVTPQLDIEPAHLSERSLGDLESEISTIQVVIDDTAEALKQIALVDMASLTTYQTSLEQSIDYTTVELSGDKKADNRLLLLESWVPKDAEASVVEYLEHSGIYYQAEDAKIIDKDKIPIKLKNSYFATLFEPIMKMFSLPNYSENDVTPWFAPFYLLFFALCMGDAGYGVLIAVAAMIIRPRLAEDMRNYASLVVWLGWATVIVGYITGVFFGIDISQWAWIPGHQYMITDAHYASYFGGNSPMMIFAVGIGLVQIFLGMGLNVVKLNKQFGWKHALAPAAWMVFLIGGGTYIGCGTFFGTDMPAWLTYSFYGLLGVSALPILFFNTPEKNPLVNLGTAIWDAYNVFSGLLGDTLSYIRLFALGLSGAILGSVFNMLAFQMTETMALIPQIIVAGLILLIGHAMNIALCLISAFVHPLRLTFVEFFKNSGFEGGGPAYKPFKKL